MANDGADVSSGTIEASVIDKSEASSSAISATDKPSGEDDISQTQAPLALPTKIVERRELVHYGDLYSSESVSESEPEPVEVASPSEDSSDSESSASREGLLRTALTPIEKEIEGYNPSADLPENGSQFLLKVRHERKHVPKVVSAPKSLVEKVSASKAIVDSKPYKVTKIPKCIDTPAALQQFLPTQSWMSIITHQFSTLSLKVEYWRAMMADQGASITLPDGIVLPPFEITEKKWMPFCFGTKICNQLKSTPRKRKAVSSADANAISSFFSDDIHVLVCDVKIPTQSTETHEVILMEEALKDLTTLSISEPGLELKTGEAAEAVDVEDKVSNSVSSDSEDEEELLQEKQAPLLSILLNLPITTIEDLLAMHINWLSKYGWFHEFQGKWIYALLACLVRPLSCDVVSEIRKLVRICCSLRKWICESRLALSSTMNDHEKQNSKQSTDSDDLENVQIKEEIETKADTETTIDNTNAVESEENIRFKEFINNLNLFVCLASNYFQQFDLADSPRPF